MHVSLQLPLYKRYKGLYWTKIHELGQHAQLCKKAL